MAFTSTVHRPFMERCSTLRMSDVPETRRRIAARDALAARTRVLTGAALAVSAALSGLFAGIAAASAPGHKLSSKTPAAGTQTTGGQTAAHSSTAIPPLPAASGPGNVGSASPAPTPAPAPSPTPSPPAVVSGGS
jgi:hypothetical protein